MKIYFFQQKDWSWQCKLSESGIIGLKDSIKSFVIESEDEDYIANLFIAFVVLDKVYKKQIQYKCPLNKLTIQNAIELLIASNGGVEL